MNYKRILTIQDISCVGQCSLTVALPIISACGVECAILPSAVLSTHTGGFSNFTFCDLTEEIPKIHNHWREEKISFDAIYTGYLGSTKQIDYVKAIMDAEKTVNIIDPVFADHGKLYYGFDLEYVAGMKKLIKTASFILPNITEACFLTGTEYKENYDAEYIEMLLDSLSKITDGTVILTGVSYEEGKTGVIVYKDKEKLYYEHKKIDKSYHGTGDIFASAFTGAYMGGKSAFEAAKIAADYTISCIEETAMDDSHWYGVKFEKTLPKLIEML
ncbi:MAG: pyridoxamine kinase [Clostridia bacterium]|nr:pyridoxamine kinase [Clostridia bacterium]